MGAYLLRQPGRALDKVGELGLALDLGLVLCALGIVDLAGRPAVDTPDAGRVIVGAIDDCKLFRLVLGAVVVLVSILDRRRRRRRQRLEPQLSVAEDSEGQLCVRRHSGEDAAGGEAQRQTRWQVSRALLGHWHPLEWETHFLSSIFSCQFGIFSSRKGAIRSRIGCPKKRNPTKPPITREKTYSEKMPLVETADIGAICVSFVSGTRPGQR